MLHWLATVFHNRILTLLELLIMSNKNLVGIITFPYFLTASRMFHAYRGRLSLLLKMSI